MLQATEVCVTAAIEGMNARGFPTIAVREAIYGLGLEPEHKTLTRWLAGGTALTSSAALIPTRAPVALTPPPASPALPASRPAPARGRSR